MSTLSRERGQTVPEFFGRAKNLIGFSCQEKSFFVCRSQIIIRSPQNSTTYVVLLFDPFTLLLCPVEM